MRIEAPRRLVALLVLCCASAAEEPSHAPELARLTDLKHLSFSDAVSRRSVRVRAVVTYVDQPWGILFVQDDTAASYVDMHNVNVQLQPGDVVDIAGVSGPGRYAPQIEKPAIAFVRHGTLPQPLKLDLAQENPAADSKWCAFQGVVHAAHNQDGHTILEVGAGSSDVNVLIPMLIGTQDLVDREVVVSGVFGVLFNERRQAVGRQIFVPSSTFLRVTEEQVRVASPVGIGSLRRYDPDTDQRHAVRLQGTVVLKRDASTVFLQDGSAGIEVRGAGPLAVEDGNEVLVQGFVTSGEFSPVLEHGLVLTRSSGQKPLPYSISVETALEGRYDSEYVMVQANLTAVRATAAGTVLVLNDAGRLFEAFGPDGSSVADLRPGSEVEVRGVCRNLVDPLRFALTGFTLDFDSPQSITVLRAGPWWDAHKVTWMLFAVALGASFATLWILVLRQRVQAKTHELQFSVASKRKAQEFDAARNQVLEAIARNAPPPESMEHLARAVEKQIEGSLCAIALSPDGKSFLNETPSAVLIAPNLTDELQRQMLPMLSSVLVTSGDAADCLKNDNDVMASMMELASNVGLDVCDGEIAVAFSGTGELAGLIMVFFREEAPADPESVTRVLQSASRLVSLARDHWHMHEQLVFDARHDALTGLPNRTVAEDRLEQALARAERRRQIFAVLCIDLDGFKGVNDNLGHHAGDELLRAVANRLRVRIRHSDTLARIGGDEFLAIVEDCATDSAAQCVGESLIATLQEPIVLDGKQVSISGSIGIAIYPTDGRHAADLKRHADQAMYRAKAAGRGRTCFWSADAPSSAAAAKTSRGG